MIRRHHRFPTPGILLGALVVLGTGGPGAAAGGDVSGVTDENENIPTRPQEVFRDENREAVLVLSPALLGEEQPDIVALRPQDVAEQRPGSSAPPASTAGPVVRPSVFPNPSRGPVTVRAGSSLLAAEVYDVSGRHVASIHGNVGTAIWSGRDATGGIAPPGVYFARVRAKGTGVQTVKILRR